MAKNRISKPTNLTLKPEALEILSNVENKSKLVTEAIISKHELETKKAGK